MSSPAYRVGMNCHARYQWTIRKPDGQSMTVVGTRISTDGSDIMVYQGREVVLVVQGKLLEMESTEGRVK